MNNQPTSYDDGSARILIVDDQPSVAETLARTLARLVDSVEVMTAANGQEALDKLSDHSVDMVITDYKMPGMTGLELIEALRKNKSQTPTMLMTGYPSSELQASARELGVGDYLVKPFPPERIRDAVLNILDNLSTKTTSSKTILYVDDDVQNQALIDEILSEYGYQVNLVSNGLDALHSAEGQAPDLILMDVNIPYMNGYEAATYLKSVPQVQHIPILALRSDSDDIDEARCLVAGYDGFLDIEMFDTPVALNSLLRTYLSGRRDKLPLDKRIAHLEYHNRQLAQRLEKLVNSLAAANDQLRVIDRVKSDFLAVTSHELRTPLTTIVGYTYMLLDLLKEAGEHEMLASVQGIARGAERLHTHVDNILEVAQISADPPELEFQLFHLKTVLKMLDRDWKSAVKERSIKLKIKNLKLLPKIKGDIPKLYRVFDELISNAVKYTPDGGEIIINCKVHRSNHQDHEIGSDSIEITVSDSGIGIPREDQRLIFTKFYVAENTDLHSSGREKFKAGGMGLGLAIAQGIIEAHGGKIWVESEGRDEQDCPGSVIHVLLPVLGNEVDLASQMLVNSDFYDNKEDRNNSI